MKNKKNIYFLVPAVLTVWGLLGYKIFSGLNPTVQDTVTIELGNQFTPKSIKESDKFTINTNYRDPFLGTFEKKQKKTVTKKRVPIVKKELVPFPSILYKGIVSPKGNNETVFLVNINGQQYFFKKKEIFNEVKLLKGNTQEIVLQFHKQRKTFLIED